MAFNHDNHDSSHVGLRNAVLYLLKREEFRQVARGNEDLRKCVSDLIAGIKPSLFVYDMDARPTSLHDQYMKAKAELEKKDTPAPPAESPKIPDKVRGRVRVYREIDKDLHIEHDSTLDFPIKADVHLGDQHFIIGVELVGANLTVYRCSTCGGIGTHGPAMCPICKKPTTKYRLEEVTEAC